MKFFIRGIPIAAVVLFLAWWARAADERDPNKFRMNVDMVQLRATITDHNGAYVRNLTAKDFHVFENGEEQEVRVVSGPTQAESTTNVLVLLDTSNQMYETFAYLEDAVADFIRRLAPADSVALFSFSRNMVRLAPLSADRQAVLASLRNAVLGDDTAFYNGVLLALRDAERMQGSKVLVVFSNGPDRRSMLAPEDVQRVAEDAGVPIYVVSANTHSETAMASLRDLAEKTGGRTFFASDWRRQRAAFESIDRDLNNTYQITYYPSQKADAAYRKIDVRVTSETGHTFHVRTREGYRVSRP
jgi:Ca-activated chloride channel homolog